MKTNYLFYCKVVQFGSFTKSSQFSFDCHHCDLFLTLVILSYTFLIVYTFKKLFQLHWSSVRRSELWNYFSEQRLHDDSDVVTQEDVTDVADRQSLTEFETQFDQEITTSTTRTISNREMIRNKFVTSEIINLWEDDHRRREKWSTLEMIDCKVYLNKHYYLNNSLRILAENYH